MRLAEQKENTGNTSHATTTKATTKEMQIKFAD